MVPRVAAARSLVGGGGLGVVGVPEMQVEEQLGQGERSVVWVFASELGLARAC